MGEKNAFAAGALVNKGPASLSAGSDQYSKASTSLPVTSPHPVAFSSATAALYQRRVRHCTVDTDAQYEDTLPGHDVTTTRRRRDDDVTTTRQQRPPPHTHDNDVRYDEAGGLCPLFAVY